MPLDLYNYLALSYTLRQGRRKPFRPEGAPLSQFALKTTNALFCSKCKPLPPSAVQWPILIYNAYMVARYIAVFVSTSFWLEHEPPPIFQSKQVAVRRHLSGDFNYNSLHSSASVWRRLVSFSSGTATLSSVQDMVESQSFSP